MRPPLLLLLLALAPPEAHAPAHPGLMRMTGAGRGPLLGVPANLRMKYPAVAKPCGDFTCHTGNFTCLGDEQQVVPARKINDGECDCEDGSDEPSTSACPSGRFFCVNKRHTPQWLNSSRVNDGACDCCDGTDEHGRGGCPSTCVMLASYERHVKQAARAPVLPAASTSARQAQRAANEQARRAMQVELEQLQEAQASSEQKYLDWVAQHGEDAPEPADSTPQLAPAEEVAAEPAEVADEEVADPPLPRVMAIKGRPFARGEDLRFKEGDVLVVERKDDIIWWFGYVEGDEDAGRGRFARNLVVAVSDKVSEARRQHVLQEARGDVKAQTAGALAALEDQRPKRVNKEEAIAQARERAEARANGEAPHIATLASVTMDDEQLHRTAKMAHVALRRERVERAEQISRLARRLSDDVSTDWLHLRGHCLTLAAGEQGQFNVCLFEKVERLPLPARAPAGASGEGACACVCLCVLIPACVRACLPEFLPGCLCLHVRAPSSRLLRPCRCVWIDTPGTPPTMQLIGRWNSTRWQLASWPGKEPVDADGDDAEGSVSDSPTAGVSVTPPPILMHFDGGVPCAAQPGLNYSATVRTHHRPLSTLHYTVSQCDSRSMSKLNSMVVWLCGYVAVWRCLGRDAV